MPAPYHGSCICGAIRFRVVEEPLTLYACHCTDCQRQTGSGFALSMIVRRADLERIAGDPRGYRVDMPDGRVKRGRFCGECSTRLWGEPDAFPAVVVVRPGTLDEARELEPIGHIWTGSAQPWVKIPEGAYCFEAQPSDPMTLVKAWRESGGP